MAGKPNQFSNLDQWRSKSRFSQTFRSTPTLVKCSDGKYRVGVLETHGDPRFAEDGRICDHVWLGDTDFWVPREDHLFLADGLSRSVLGNCVDLVFDSPAEFSKKIQWDNAVNPISEEEVQLIVKARSKPSKVMAGYKW